MVCACVWVVCVKSQIEESKVYSCETVGYDSVYPIHTHDAGELHVIYVYTPLAELQLTNDVYMFTLHVYMATCYTRTRLFASLQGLT